MGREAARDWKARTEMKTKSQVFWAVYFVGFDYSESDDPESCVEPYVGKERIESNADPEDVWYDVNLAILARGGQLLTIVGDDEFHAEAIRLGKELEILRGR